MTIFSIQQHKKSMQTYHFNSSNHQHTSAQLKISETALHKINFNFANCHDDQLVTMISWELYCTVELLAIIENDFHG